MTNSTQYPKKPSAKFLKTLRDMAEERGVTFAYPATVAEAREQFNRLKNIPRQPRYERRGDAAAVRASLANAGGSSRVRDEEVAGWGSSARWR